MQTTSSKSGTGSLVAGAIAALVASVCCVGPLVLVLLGVGGAWVANLTALEPYRPIFVGVALVFLGLAFRKLYLVPAACAPGEACAVPAARRRRRLVFWVVAVVALALLTFPWYAALFY
jgi:mercuric ion transport protein